MAYVNPNFGTKKELVAAVKAGKFVEVYEPGLGSVPRDGDVSLQGPHYPRPHTWYARGTMRDGLLVGVR